jgi:hypothetical protein
MSQAKKKVTAMTPVGDTALELVAELAEHAGMGTEFEKGEIAIPFVKILQSMSPQCKRAEDGYVSGSEEGDLFHTILNRPFKKLYFIPCQFQHLLIQWKNRESGGGFVAAYEAGDPLVPATVRQDFREVVKDDPESYIDNTLQYVCLIFDEDMTNLGPAVLSFKSSQLKYARRFNASLAAKKLKRADGSTFRAPIFSHIYELTTQPERNDKGSWFSFALGEGVFVQDTVMLREALEFAKSLMDTKKIIMDTEDQAAKVTDADTSFEI